MMKLDVTITVQRELIGAVAAFHRHDSCYSDECVMAPEPHTPCDPGLLLVNHIKNVIDYLGEISSQDAEGREQAA